MPLDKQNTLSKFNKARGKYKNNPFCSRCLQEELATQVKERSSSTSGAKRGKSKKEKGFQNFTRRLAGRQVCLRLGQCSVTQAPQQGITRFLNNRKRPSRHTYITRHRQQTAQNHCAHISALARSNAALLRLTTHPTQKHKVERGTPSPREPLHGAKSYVC